MDPRDKCGYDGVDAHYTTYDHDNSIVFDDAINGAAGGSAQVGRALTLVNSHTVGLADNGQMIVGKLILVETGGKCNVQDGGYMPLPGGAAAALTPGRKIVGAQGPGGAKGYIREVAVAVAAELRDGRGEIVDATDTTAVVVKL